MRPRGFPWAFVCLLLGAWPVLAGTGSGFDKPFLRVDQVPGNLLTGDGRPILVLDTRSSRAYDRGHLPGAVNIDWTDHRAGWLREGRLPSNLESLARDLAKEGVDVRRPVLVCGDAEKGWGEEGRIAWMLRYLGHPEVAILDGGCRSWARASRQMVTTESRAPRGTFPLRVKANLRADKAEVDRARKDPKVQILDVRTQAEFAGKTPYFSSRGGHVPGAVHLYWKDLVDPETGRVRSKDAVYKILKKAGIRPEAQVIAYCTGGVRSAFVVEVLGGMGRKAKNYDGSWWEWSADDELPVEK